MPKMKKLRCFVAMAFGHKDANSIYTNAIRPTACSLDMTCTRVDQKEHNRNINDVITDEIGRADVVIADLTYARPSVYFEAGLAEPQIPGRVIYTVRRDHFTPSEDDPERNRAVHFDVSMRNIIGWGDPSDASFSKKLERRLRHVLKPLWRERARDEARATARAKFGKLSSDRQLDQMLEEGTSGLRRAKLRKASLGDLDPHVILRLHAVQPRLALAAARNGDRVTFAGIAPVASWAANGLGLTTNFWDRSLPTLLGRSRQLGNRDTVEMVHDHLILCSPKKAPIARIRDRYKEAHQGPDPRCLIFPDDRTLLREEPFARAIKEELRERSDSPARRKHMWLIGGVRSISDMREQLDEILPALV